MQPAKKHISKEMGMIKMSKKDDLAKKIKILGNTYLEILNNLDERILLLEKKITELEQNK